MEREPKIEGENEYSQSLQNAKMVQQGLLAKKRHFKRLFKESFVTYIPQNEVSGDFYWIGERHNLRYVLVGDCTGHGISAALLSVLALNLFEYAIMNKGIKKTNKILKEVDKRFIESFKSNDKGTFDNPWIDLSIVCIDEAEQKIYYSSANRKMLKINANNEKQVFKGCNYPIGGWKIEKNRCFEAITIHYEKDDIIYLGSDGFQDQIGGEYHKKYKSKNLHALIAKNSHLSLAEQKVVLENEFYNWKKDEQQLDDVSIVGIKL